MPAHLITVSEGLRSCSHDSIRFVVTRSQIKRYKMQRKSPSTTHIKRTVSRTTLITASVVWSNDGLQKILQRIICALFKWYFPWQTSWSVCSLSSFDFFFCRAALYSRAWRCVTERVLQLDYKALCFVIFAASFQTYGSLFNWKTNKFRYN